MIIPALQRLRQEDREFKASQGFIARPCLKTSKKYKPHSIKTSKPSYTNIELLNFFSLTHRCAALII
jgi:hypothetical protein